MGTAQATIRQTLNISSTPKIYERMLTSASKENYQKVEKALQLLQPLIQHLDQTYSLSLEKDIREAIQNNLPNKLVQELQRLVCYSIKDLFREAAKASDKKSEISPIIREAFSEYLTLDFYIRPIDFESSKRIKANFRVANSAAGLKNEQFQSAVKDIETDLEVLFHNNELG